MKSPPQQFTDDEARQKTEEFIQGDEEVELPTPMKRNGNGHRNGKRKTARRKSANWFR